jgi:hypothetical protein
MGQTKIAAWSISWPLEPCASFAATTGRLVMSATIIILPDSGPEAESGEAAVSWDLRAPPAFLCPSAPCATATVTAEHSLPQKGFAQSFLVQII